MSHTAQETAPISMLYEHPLRLQTWRCECVQQFTCKQASRAASYFLLPTSLSQTLKPLTSCSKDRQTKWHNPMSKNIPDDLAHCAENTNYQKELKRVGSFLNSYYINVYYPSSILTSSNSRFII